MSALETIGLTAGWPDAWEAAVFTPSLLGLLGRSIDLDISPRALGRRLQAARVWALTLQESVMRCGA